MHDWYIYYKVARGKPLNTIVGGAYVNASVAASVVHESHGFWTDMMTGKTQADKISREQTSNKDWRKTYVNKEVATKKFGIPKKSKVQEAKPKPERYQHWFYLDSEFKPIELKKSEKKLRRNGNRIEEC